MLFNPVKTKSMVITTRQKHQLSDLSLRLSMDGQDIENVTEHHHIDYACGMVVAKYTLNKLNSYIKGQANESFLILPNLQSKR